jgi:hypothetical protein
VKAGPKQIGKLICGEPFQLQTPAPGQPEKGIGLTWAPT